VKIDLNDAELMVISAALYLQQKVLSGATGKNVKLFCFASGALKSRIAKETGVKFQ